MQREEAAKTRLKASFCLHVNKATILVVEETNIDTPYGVKLNKTTKVTPRGQVYIIERFKKELS